MKTKIAWLLAAAAIAGIVGWRIYRKAVPGGDGARGRGPRAVAVRAEPARTETIRRMASFTGSLEARAMYAVASKVPGRLERLLVDLGDVVTNGARIAELDGEEYRQQVEQARAELEVARATLAETQSALDVAGREYERAKDLRAQQVASAAELDQAEALFKAAGARNRVTAAVIRQREAALRGAEIRLAYTAIAASWPDGSSVRAVAERFADEGAMLKANDPLVSLADLSRLTAVIHIIERDFPAIRIGQAVALETDAYPGRRFAGRVARRAPVLREASRQARVEIEVPNPDAALAPGLFVRAQIELERHDGARTVPTHALVRRDERKGLFLADPDGRTARFVEARTGITEGERTEILAPPLDGPVIVLGQHLLSDGSAISIVGDDPPPAAGRAAESRP